MPTMTKSSIPDWYTADWQPARGHGELSRMSWEAVEAAIEALALPASRTTAAVTLFRMLWLESARLGPMELLQRFLLTGAMAMDTGERLKPSAAALQTIPTAAAGALPRWSYTDLEVALAYTWHGTALMIANQRHRDLLNRRGERDSDEETARQILLLVSGLPVSTQARASAADESLRAAA